MTICFTLPYSGGGEEERRIKFDLVTAIIKCSLLASIKARGLMLTWLTLMQPQGAWCTYLHQLHFVTLFNVYVQYVIRYLCECLSASWLWKYELAYGLLSALHAC